MIKPGGAHSWGLESDECCPAGNNSTFRREINFQMMKIVWLLLFDLFFCSGVFGQQNDAIIVKTGNTLQGSISDTDLYQYPRFEKGKVVFKNGTSTEARLNYNRFLGEMHFINTNGDTLTVDDEETISLVLVNADSFYYDKVFVMLVSNNSLLKLGRKEGFRILDKQKKSAYDMSSSISSIRSVNSLNDEGRLHKIAVTEDVMLAKEVRYYFGNKFNHFIPASKKNLLELLPNQRSDIRNYLKTNEIDFDKKDDLDKLLRFLTLL